MSDKSSLITLGRSFLKAGQAREAFATLHHVLVAHGPSADLDRWLGAAAQQCEEDDVAIQAYERALQTTANDIEVIVNLAEIYLSRVVLDRAAALLEQAMTLDPTATHRSGVRARVLIMKAKKQFS